MHKASRPAATASSRLPAEAAEGVAAPQEGARGHLRPDPEERRRPERRQLAVVAVVVARPLPARQLGRAGERLAPAAVGRQPVAAEAAVVAAVPPSRL